MEYSPPPLFKQGASARAKVVIFSILAIVLLVADAHLQTLSTVRQVVGTMLYPLQRLALMPRDAVYGIGHYFSSLSRLEQENEQFKRQQIANSHALQQAKLLEVENVRLRKLLEASERLPVKSLMTEILYDARDSFTRKIILDRGAQHGVKTGQPVIDDTGVVGQITRVFTFTSEATLLTDKDQAIPVQVVRSGLRSVAYGRGQSGVLDLRFMAANADIQKGDLLVTSGIDGVYPPGLAVAKVAEVESKSSDAFAKIICQPAAGIDRNRQLLILLAEAKLPPRPPEEDLKSLKERKAAEKAENAKKPKEAGSAPAAAAPAAGKPAEPSPSAPKPGTVTAPASAAVPAQKAQSSSPAASTQLKPVTNAGLSAQASSVAGARPAQPAAVPVPSQPATKPSVEGASATQAAAPAARAVPKPAPVTSSSSMESR